MSAGELIATPPQAPPPFDILRAAFVELHVTDLAASEHFYAELLGMIVSARTDDAVYLRGWEERQHHSLILRRSGSQGAGRAAVGGPGSQGVGGAAVGGPGSQVAGRAAVGGPGSLGAVGGPGSQGAVGGPAAARLGLRVRSEHDLDLAGAWFQERGLPVRWLPAGLDPGIGRCLCAWDPFGYPLALFHAVDHFETQHQRFDLHRGAPLLRFDHLNLHCPRVEEAFRFWLSLGFRCSEYISTDGDDERLTGAWLLRKPTVHDIALTAGTGPRLHHFAYWVADPTGVLRACDQLAGQRRSDVIERGPGRHGVSNAFFVYLRDPDGHRIELYSCDYYTGDPDHVPLRWSVNDPRCRSFWGARAPDSWYDESSLVLGPDGSALPVSPAQVDERDQRSEVLA